MQAAHLNPDAHPNPNPNPNQVAHREARAQLHEQLGTYRKQLYEAEQLATSPTAREEHVPGAHGRIEVFREAQKELRTVRQQAKLAHLEFDSLPVRQGGAAQAALSPFMA